MIGGGDRISGRAFATRSEVIARHGMAATSQPLATQVALDILRRGGSAVDAAIAANAALGLMEPTGNGVGGDLFAIVWDAQARRLHGLDASGRSPRSLTRGHFIEQRLDRIPSHGPLSVSVPGCVDGWIELHARFGRLPLADVLQPAIDHARAGFPVSELIAHDWHRGARFLADSPGFAETFLPGGRAPRKGEIFRNPGLAATLETVADAGRDGFYGGRVAAAIESFCGRAGCFLTRADLAAHRSTWTEPVATSYRGVELWELPPSGQGIAALQMLNILEGFDLKGMAHNSVDYLHHLIEAKKIVYEDRARHYADMRFAAVPVERLISKQYAAERRALLSPDRAALACRPGAINLGAADARLRAGDTVYLAVADADRNMVSLIQSNYRGFGSGLCPDGLGFGLQDRGALFSLEEGHPNVYEPGKRPFHTIIPAFATRAGVPWLSFGVMGGDMQPQGHVQILLNLIEFEMNLQEAGDAARVYHTGSSSPTGGSMSAGGVVALESGVPVEVQQGLIDKHHRLRSMRGPFGGYQAIAWDPTNDVWIGASESRKDGQAAGY